jgi:hypothetical protein
MKLKNVELWKDLKKNNQDFYGSAIIRYAELWADTMEAGINAGKELKDIAESSSQLADTKGITGYMYGIAVGILSECWENGDELRKWHNRQYDISDDEKGIVNPAGWVVTLPKED